MSVDFWCGVVFGVSGVAILLGGGYLGLIALATFKGGSIIRWF